MAYNKIVYGGSTIIDLTEDTVTADKLLSGYTAHGEDGEKVTGSMTNREAVTGTISTKEGQYTVPVGYHNGSGTVGISPVEKAKIISGNIKNGVSILGVAGTYQGEPPTTQTKTVTPAVNQQRVTPDSGKYLSEVTVNAIPYREIPNEAGGITVEIAVV